MSADLLCVESIAQQFVINGIFIGIDEVDTGLINSTYIAKFKGEGGVIGRYIIQRINDHVFPDPIAVMNNVERVITHISSKTSAEKSERLLKLFSSKEGLPYFQDSDGGIWRCYNFIEGCRTYDTVETPEQAYQAAFAFGEFQNKLSDLSSDDIVETIPDFHHTPKRFLRLMELVTTDPLGRLHEVTAELEFIKDREPTVHHLVNLRDAGKLPVRITHNDTKFNNVMVDEQSDEAICVIDLDTVMPGLSLYDFGDLVRTSVSPSSEESLDGVSVRMPVFEALVDGYLSACDCLSDTEVENLAVSAKVITLELAIRFLTDFLEGDIYFKTDQEQQNLHRARVQLQLVRRLEEREQDMIQTVAQRAKL